MEYITESQSGRGQQHTHDVRNAGPALFYQPETVHDVSHPYLYLEGLRLLDALSFVRHSGGIRIPD